MCTPGQGEQCEPSCGGRKSEYIHSVLAWQNLWRCCVISNDHLPSYPSTEKRDVAATAVAKEPRMVMTVGPLLMGRVEEAHQVP